MRKITILSIARDAIAGAVFLAGIARAEMDLQFDLDRLNQLTAKRETGGVVAFQTSGEDP